MSEICVLLGKLAALIEREGHRSLFYCTAGTTTCATEPAPYLEFTFMERGQINEVAMGPETYRFPEGHLVVHNVHFGCKASPGSSFRSKCIFFDPGQERAFHFLTKKPFCHPIRIPDHGRMAAAFDTLVTRSHLASWLPPKYPVNPEFVRHRSVCGLSMAEGLFITSALLEILALAVEACGSSDTGGSSGISPGVRRAMEFIKLRSGETGLSLSDIAEAACLDGSHLGRSFREMTGMTPMRYLRSVRISRATVLLERSDLPVAEVSRECGFTNQFHFSRVFHEERGVSPLECRRRARCRVQI